MVKKLDFTFDTPQWFRYVAASQLLLDDCIAEKCLIEALLPVHQLHVKCGRGVVQQFLVQFCSCLSGGGESFLSENVSFVTFQSPGLWNLHAGVPE